MRKIIEENRERGMGNGKRVNVRMLEWGFRRFRRFRKFRV